MRIKWANDMCPPCLVDVRPLLYKPSHLINISYKLSDFLQFVMQIYKTVNLINGKWYIGKDAGDRDYYLGSGSAITNAIKKYGKENFKKIKIEECDSLEQLKDREKYWIKITNAIEDEMSYNILPGGEGGDWTAGMDSDIVKEIYTKRGYRGDYFSGARNWLNSLTEKERKDFYSKQGMKRAKGWYISRIESPEIEIYVVNIRKWCLENNFGLEGPTKLTTPGNSMYQKQSGGWRFRREDQPPLPPYENKRTLGHASSNKGKSWKLIDGKRTYFDKTEENNLEVPICR